MFVLSSSFIQRLPLCLSSSQLLFQEKRCGGGRRCGTQFPGALIGSASVSALAQTETQNLTQGQITEKKKKKQKRVSLIFGQVSLKYCPRTAWPGPAQLGLVWFGPGRPLGVRMRPLHCFHMMTPQGFIPTATSGPVESTLMWVHLKKI